MITKHNAKNIDTHERIYARTVYNTYLYVYGTAQMQLHTREVNTRVYK